MDQLPENTWLSAHYCNRWSNRLLIDGKYVKVRGYERKIPFIYTVDYLTHDIPAGILAPSENEEAFLKLFRLLKTIKYPLQITICDEASGLQNALREYYPKARVQLCQNHYLENIRQRLQVRTLEKYQQFFYLLKAAFSSNSSKIHPKKREAVLRHAYHVYAKKDPLLQIIMIEIEARKHELFSYTWRMNKCTNTTNLIEAYNSHLQGRLKTIKGFESFQSAERLLNAWMLRRRTKPFTDCQKPFKYLNGKMSLEMTIRKDAKWPVIYGCKRKKTP